MENEKFMSIFDILTTNLKTYVLEKINEIISDFSFWKKIISCLLVTEHNKNMKKAEVIYENAWIKTSCDNLFKRLFSETEWTKKLGKRGIEAMLVKLNTGISILENLKKRIERIEKTMKFADLSLEAAAKYAQTNNLSVDNAEQFREEVRKSREELLIFMKLLMGLKNMTPPIYCTYFDFVETILNNADGIILVAENYSDKIYKLIREIQQKIQSNFNQKTITSGDSLYLFRSNLPLNTQLNILEKRSKKR